MWPIGICRMIHTEEDRKRIKMSDCSMVLDLCGALLWVPLGFVCVCVSRVSEE